MDEKGMRTAIVAWIKGLYVSPPPIVYDFQAFPETGPWIAFKIGTIVQKGYDSQLGLNSDYQMVYGGLRIATITISYFGYSPENSVNLNYAMQNASLIRSSLEKNNIQQTFNDAGYAYLHKENIHNSTYLLESKYQPRADFDFYLGFFEEQTDDEGYINSAKFEGDISGNHVEAIVDPF